MSTVVMSACWPLQGMSPAQKAVLISLADQSNDDGICWPSVRTIAIRTCLSERAVQLALRWLESEGFLQTKERRGTSTVYQVTPADAAPLQEMHPRTKCTPPPQEMHPTPADAAPHPRISCTLTINEPSINRKRTSKSADSVEPPEGVSPETWGDFLKLRKAKRAPLTKTALNGIKLEADKAGMTLEQALSTCCKRGWQGFDAEWVSAGKPSGQQSNIPRGLI